MPEEDQTTKPGVLIVTALHTDALDTYKFLIPYAENLHAGIGYITDALTELAEFIQEPRQLNATVTEFSSVESVKEAVAFWSDNRPEDAYLDINISRLVEDHTGIWQLYHNLEKEIKFQLKRTTEPDSSVYSITQATFDDVIDIFREFFTQWG